MSDLISQLEKILKDNLIDHDIDSINIRDDDSIYRKFYFDYLPEKAAKEALYLFPNGKNIYKKYSAIISRFSAPTIITDLELTLLIQQYLEASAKILDQNEDKEVIEFIDNLDGINAIEQMPNFKPGDNILHKFVYGAISEYILENLPDDDAYWLLYDWSLEKTKWATVTAYLLEDLLDNKEKDMFNCGFKLWESRNSNRYWAERNNFSTNAVYCHANRKPN